MSRDPDLSVCHYRAVCLSVTSVGADIDDDECGNLAHALMFNRSITSIALTNNMIGGKETTNLLHPDQTRVTGAAAIGQMLIENRTLTELDLSWNFITKGSAVALADALTVNSTLKVLKLGNPATLIAHPQITLSFTTILVLYCDVLIWLVAAGCYCSQVTIPLERSLLKRSPSP